MEPQRTGSISLSLSSDREVVVDTKAETVDCSNFLVDIYGETFLGQSYKSEQFKFSEMTEPVVIPFGYYYVSAQNLTEAAAEEGYGSVRYYGVSEEVDILSNETTAVQVVCKMANGKVTFTLDASFLEDFEDASVEMTVGSRTVSMDGSDADGSNDVYFNVSEEGMSLIYKVFGTVGKGTEQEKRLTYTNASSPLTLMPAKWAKITIKSNHNGIIGPGITVDGNMGNDSFTESIDPEEGSEIVDVELVPVVTVDTDIDEATVVDCIIDVL